AAATARGRRGHRRTRGRSLSLAPVAIPVRAGLSGYDALIGPGLIGSLGKCLRSIRIQGRAALISDATVLKHLGLFARERLSAAGLEVTPVARPPGESTKPYGAAEPI